ncbi:MAG: disulfide reductase, partial [Chloroflexi bacterium]|nr:disulfide reductase [Chloroflexota bacterium]
MKPKYSYYPGCSLERNAQAYNQSAVAVAERLGFELDEIDDWNCCGAVEYIALEMLPSYALVARNLVLAANQSGNGCQVVAPCSACYLNLRKAVRYMRDDPKLAEGVNMALAAGGLEYKQDSVKVRHLLDVVVNDVGHEQIADMVTKPLYGLKIAPYYGCLLARPEWYGRNDDPEYPTSMDKLMQILGAEVVEFQAR